MPTRLLWEHFISIHALREEGDLDAWHYADDYNISIHALREEGDELHDETAGTGHTISIHALREEGDPGCTTIP